MYNWIFSELREWCAEVRIVIKNDLVQMKNQKVRNFWTWRLIPSSPKFSKNSWRHFFLRPLTVTWLFYFQLLRSDSGSRFELSNRNIIILVLLGSHGLLAFLGWRLGGESMIVKKTTRIPSWISKIELRVKCLSQIKTHLEVEYISEN